MTMITPSYLGETIEYSSLHACRSTLEDPTTALNRYGQVDEIAAMVAFVAGPESSYITGANLTVDGGMNA